MMEFRRIVAAVAIAALVISLAWQLSLGFCPVP
jgi:hypothetical protein